MEDYSTHQQIVVQEAEQNVQRAMQLLDDRLVDEYRHAVSAVPRLVATETPVVHFLRTEDFHPTLAAVRLARYWKLRRELFGKRWLLPMTQTGTGALTQDLVDILRPTKGMGRYIA